MRAVQHPHGLKVHADVILCMLGLCLSILLSLMDCNTQPPDPALLIGNPMAASSLSPSPQPNPPRAVAAQASAFPKTALGVVLGIGIPLTLGVGMLFHICFVPSLSPCMLCSPV